MTTALLRFWNLFLVSFACLAGTLSARPAGASADITVQVYNWAHVDAGTLMAAEGEAARIFREAGVGITWLNCPLSVAAAEASPICAEPRPWGPFILRIVYDVPPGFGNTSMGVALNETGIYASVFYQRVDEFANEGIATHSQILGHAMAHELGHLLLDLRGHTNFGIMRGRWNVQDLRSASMGALLFSSEQRAPIREAVSRRMHGQITVTFLATAPVHLAASDVTLTLVIYNHAHVGDETLAQAEKTVSEIFERAGVRLIWRDGFAYAAERRNAVAPAAEDPATLVVKLQPQSEATRYHVRSNCGGIGFASGAIIFVRNFDATWLGHVTAHELGHILLGPNAHSIVGIMRGTLLQEDWAKAAQGTLGFSRSENQQIRTWIAKRNRH